MMAKLSYARLQLEATRKPIRVSHKENLAVEEKFTLVWDLNPGPMPF